MSWAGGLKIQSWCGRDPDRFHRAMVEVSQSLRNSRLHSTVLVKLTVTSEFVIAWMYDD